MKNRNTLEQAIGIPFTSGNKIEVLKNGDQIFSAMLDSIRSATTSIDFLTYVYWTGNIADKFAEALSAKAKEGLTVRVLLDGYGAKSMDRQLIETMENAGVDVHWFRPLIRWKMWKVDNRTHRKILICDNETAFTGGVGIAEEWEGDARNPNEWRDTHFKIHGPAVWGMKSAFIENWIEANDRITTDLFSDKIHNIQGNAHIQAIRTASSVRWSDIVLLYQTLLNLAQERIYLCTAYFNPNQVLIDELIERKKAGVDVKIILPGDHIDKRIAKVTAEDSFEPLISEDIEIYRYEKTMMHAKVLLIDDEISCIGSANFNHRSMLKDDEINLVVSDLELNQTLANHFNEDLLDCRQIHPDKWKQRGIGERASEMLTRVIKQQV